MRSLTAIVLVACAAACGGGPTVRDTLAAGFADKRSEVYAASLLMEEYGCGDRSFDQARGDLAGSALVIVEGRPRDFIIEVSIVEQGNVIVFPHTRRADGTFVGHADPTPDVIEGSTLSRTLEGTFLGDGLGGEFIRADLRSVLTVPRPDADPMVCTRVVKLHGERIDR